MKNIKTKQVSLSDWREEVTEGKKKGLDGKACWDGYSLKGTKKKGGKTVDNCVKVDEAKVDDVKYGKGNSDKKRKNHETDVHTLSVNKGVRTDRNNRRNRTDVVFHGHSKVERDRKKEHYDKRGVKTKGMKEEVVDEKVATGPRLGEPREKGATHVNAGEGEKIQKRTKKWMKKKGLPGAPGLEAMKAREDEHRKKRGVKNEHVEGGVQVQNVADGLNFTEIETVDIIKTQPIKGASNWKLEMVVETLISEGYTDEEILLEVDRNQGLGAWALGKGIEYTLGGIKNTINVVRNTPGAVRNVVTTAKKHYQLGKHLRNPENLSKVTRTTPKSTNTGGGLVKGFKGFLSKTKESIAKITKRGKDDFELGRHVRNQNNLTKTSKVDVLNPTIDGGTKMTNVTPNLLTKTKDIISKVDPKITASVTGAGIVAGSTVNPKGDVTGETKGDTKGDTKGETKIDKVTTEKGENKITNNGKKEIDPSKNEKIKTTEKKSGGRPFNVGREKTVDRVYGAQIAQTRKLKGDAAADKQRKKFMSRPPTSLEMEESIKYLKGGNEKNLALPRGRKIRHGVDGIDYTKMLVKNNEKQTTVAASHELEGDMTEGAVESIMNWLKLTKDPKNHEVSDKTMTGKAITGLQKRDKANQEAMKLLNQSYSWRDELGLNEDK